MYIFRNGLFHLISLIILKVLYIYKFLTVNFTNQRGFQIVRRQE